MHNKVIKFRLQKAVDWTLVNSLLNYGGDIPGFFRLRGCSLLIYWRDSDRVAFLVLILVMYHNEQLMMDHFEHNNEKCCAIYLKR